MVKKIYPKYFQWTYKKWSFWIIAILWGIWSSWGEWSKFSIGEAFGIFIFTFIMSGLIHLLAYYLAISTCNKLGHLN